MKGLFGNMFDLNRDEKLDALEMAIDYMAFNEMMKEEEEEENLELVSEDEEDGAW